jgi:membrane associated rhomboid family serine protease
MDWSLVLASQGIEAVIAGPAQGQGWRLLVEPAEQSRALQAIRLYRAENRGWGWRHQWLGSGVVFHWGALLWCWLLVLVHWLAETWGGRLEEMGAMSSGAFARGEWWRLFTAVGLHGDVAHLAANVATGLVVFGLGMARFGPGPTMLAGFLAGAAGNLAGWFLHGQPYRGLGASGMVMGGLGLLAVQSVALLRESPKAYRQFLSSLLGGFLLFVLVGLNPASDVLAHAGGFVAGLAFGLGLALLPARWGRHPRVEQAAWVTVTMLFILTWAMALWRGGPAPGGAVAR